MKKINRVAIVGGTHGNEFTGAYLAKKFDKFPEIVKRDSFETLTLLANPKALQAVKRYVDQDLNRCFASKDLQNPSLNGYEPNRAKEINQMLGPKGNPKFDFILDLHTTTANMGLSFIFVRNDPFNLKLAAYLSSIDPSLKVYSWIDPGKEQNFINSISEKGFAIEIGPIAPGTLKADIFQKTEKLTQAVLDYLDKYNQGQIPDEKMPLTVYQHCKYLDYPKTAAGELNGMIHPQLQGRDYEELQPGDPLFLTLDGNTIYYEQEKPLNPVFINEVAYYEKGIAMCLTKKEQIYV
ncbi:MAG: aspartoacylase [Cyanobacteria bacterium QH_1_48_107]|nr:MAG: aspartoacylase [Cyanobacteria bacterium QH_1_48_107]PSO69215.1 MAG: aspartoacylase [Cyanobacteria bacterium QS_1_48_34]PSO76277.1 MAG: aspartoacylase [Cyanobacteria bacterium QS_4_48_99]